jgi:two-component system, response regulator PdtaR
MLNTWNKISSKAKNDCRGRYDSMTIAVLIVEDEFLLRMDAASFIEDAGFTGYEASSNSDEAIRVLETNDNIRVVFTDISMPGFIDGLKLAHYVRGRWPPIKLIVTSGHFSPSNAELPTGASFL